MDAFDWPVACYGSQQLALHDACCSSFDGPSNSGSECMSVWLRYLGITSLLPKWSGPVRNLLAMLP